MSNTITNGTAVRLTIPSGQSLAVSSISGAFSASIVGGVGNGTVLATSSTDGAVYGPYSTGAIIDLTSSASSVIDYDIGITPVNAFNQTSKYTFDQAGNVSGLVGPDGGVRSIASAQGSQLVAALGDSITEYSVLGSQQANFVSYTAHGFMTWAMARSMGALWCPMVCTYKVAGASINYNRGKSGETAEQCLARVPELDALPIKPRFCSILVGTNNLSVNSSQTAASIMATIVQIVQGVLSRGITPVLCTLLPRGSGSAGGWSSLTAGQILTARGRLMEINRQIRAYASITPGVILADTFYSILDIASATSDPIAGYTGAGTGTADFLHPNAPGAMLVGDVWWKAVQPYTNPAPRQSAGSGDGYNSVENIFGNIVDSSWSAGAANAGTGVTGTGPSGWTCARNVGAASTAVITRQARADGGLGNEASIAMTSVSENAGFILYSGGGSIANFTNGDAFYIESEATFNTTSGDFYGNPDTYIRSTTDDSGAYAWAMTCANNNNGVSGSVFGNYSVLLRSPIVIVAQGQRSMNAWTTDGVSNGRTATSVRRNVRMSRYNKGAIGHLTF